MSTVTAKEKEVTLLDLLDRILDKGVILWGDVTLSVADVDLVYVGLKVLLSSVDTAQHMREAAMYDPSLGTDFAPQDDDSTTHRP